MKKLFSMFPSGPPGVALLLLRVCLGALLFVDQAGQIVWPVPLWLAICSVFAAAAVAVGFLTPLFALVCGVLELAALAGMAELGAPWEVLTLILAVVVALVGPGAYSIDAWMFGRRVMVLPPKR